MAENDARDPAAEALANPEKITEALELAVEDTLRLHKQTGNPICVWHQGRVVWIPAEEISLGDEPAAAGPSAAPT